MAISNEVKIEKGIPVPRGVRELVFRPFAKMEVGDSFEVGSDARDANNVRSHAINWCKLHNPKMKFVVRQLPRTNGSERIFRCWRVA